MKTGFSISRIFVLCVLSLSFFGCAYHSPSSHSLDQAEAVRVAALNPANYGTPIRLDAVVTYYDPEWHLLFVQDSSGGLFINAQEAIPEGVTVGAHIVIKGKLAVPGIGIEDPQFQVLGTSPMPVPQTLSANTDPAHLRLSQWVEVQGTVHLSAIEDGRLTLTVVNGNQRTKVRVRDRKRIWPVTLVGIKLRVDGVSAAALDDKGNITGMQVFVNSADDLKMENPAAYPYSIAPDSYSSVLHTRRPGDFVHLSGSVVEQKTGGVLVLSDGALTVRAQLADSSQFASGDEVELIGFVSISADYRIEDAIVRMISARKSAGEVHIGRVIHNLRELKSLTVETAVKQIPVEAEGVVTFFDAAANLLFVQDATAGVYVDIHNQTFDLHTGDKVRVEGVSGPGDYAPIIAAPKIKILGHGALPKPATLAVQALASGTSDGSWVQVSGVVRSVRQLQNQHTFKLAVGENNYLVQLSRAVDTSGLYRLLDAQVRIDAICGTIFNEKRQLIGIRFFVPDTASIQVLEPAPAESSLTARPIVTLLRFDPQNLSVHRVKVRGVVTLQDKNQNFYVQDSSAAIYVVAEQKTQLQPGQVVEASGYPVADPEGPYLDDASVVAVNQTSDVAPVQLAPEQMSADYYNSQLVSVEGQLLERISGPDQTILILQTGQMVLRARLQSHDLASNVRRGSFLQVTGVLQKEDQTAPASYRLALRTKNDVHVLQAASWWTPEHTVRFAVLAVIVVLVIMLWVVLGAYRVRSHQAKHDALTGLQNRNAALEYLERQMARAIRERSSIGIILADVDNFKKINDTHGHLTGDVVLKRIAAILSTDLRPYDAVGRYGGEEFLIVVPNCDASMAREVAERIRLRIEQDKFSPALPANSLPVTCSFGVAIATNTSWSVDSLLASADCALYQAKNSGRNKSVLANGAARPGTPLIG